MNSLITLAKQRGYLTEVAVCCVADRRRWICQRNELTAREIPAGAGTAAAFAGDTHDNPTTLFFCLEGTISGSRLHSCHVRFPSERRVLNTAKNTFILPRMP